jgi:L-ascorbate metabolism protein UlaG (beta-lactamase superfamily)
MKGIYLLPGIFILLLPLSGFAAKDLKKDVVQTSKGDLEITFIGHGSLIFTFGLKTIYVDPAAMAGDYSGLPKADMIFITHEHGDHFDQKALEQITTPRTSVVATPVVASQIKNSIVMKNGEALILEGFEVEAVPAYNLVNFRGDGTPYHPKGTGNGYVITFGDKRVYVAGDTENIPEMKQLKNIDIAFLPMNLPYTMTPEMVADAARAFKPKILYPYHYGDTDTSRLVDLLKNEKIEVRMRDMK